MAARRKRQVLPGNSVSRVSRTDRELSCNDRPAVSQDPGRTRRAIQDADCATRGCAVPNPSRWRLMLREEESGELSDPEYVAVRDHALPLVRGVIGGIMEAEELDAIVYPTSPTRPERVDPDPDPEGEPGGGGSAVILANMSGFPDLIVPADLPAEACPSRCPLWDRRSVSRACWRWVMRSSRVPMRVVCPGRRRRWLEKASNIDWCRLRQYQYPDM